MLALLLPLLACNLLGATSSGQPTQPAAGSQPPTNGPSAVVVAPANGSQLLLQQRLEIRVQVSDSVGITRVQLSEGGRIVNTQVIADKILSIELAFPYTATRLGTVTLEVVAYREDAAGQPAQFSLQVVGSPGELTNPAVSPTPGGIPVGGFCTASVNIENLNFRRGPSRDFESVVKLPTGEQLAIIGRTADNAWYKAKRANGQEGWVSGIYLTMPGGTCPNAPVVAN
jgi:hypothetical protein